MNPIRPEDRTPDPKLSDDEARERVKALYAYYAPIEGRPDEREVRRMIISHYPPGLRARWISTAI